MEDKCDVRLLRLKDGMLDSIEYEHIKRNFTQMRRIFWLLNMRVNEGENLPSTSAANFAHLLFHHRHIPFTIPDFSTVMLSVSIILTQTYNTTHRYQTIWNTYILAN